MPFGWTGEQIAESLTALATILGIIAALIKQLQHDKKLDAIDAKVTPADAPQEK